MNRLLIISFVEWAGAYQRPQHMAAGFAKRGWEVVYASPGYIHRRGEQVASGTAEAEGLRVVQPAALPGGSRLRAIERLNRHSMSRRLRGITDATWDAVIFNDPRWASVAREVAAHQRIFDCMDDLSSARDTQEDDTSLVEMALSASDRVWTGTYSLREKLGGRHRHVRFIPCGVDHEMFGRAIEASEAAGIASELPPGRGPLAGYFGVLNERVDMGLIEALLEAPGEWRVLLIGPATSRAPRLPEHPRLRWIGPRPYAQLPVYLAHFQLALIPYDTSGAHRYLYPVKALEYLAGRTPVLTTPLPDIVRFLTEYVEIGRTGADWQAIARRYSEAPEELALRAEAGAAYARQRGWEAMIDEMEEELK